MRDLTFKFENKVEFTAMVKEHDYMLRCIPHHLPHQQVLNFSLNIFPATGGGSFGMDSFGNRTYNGRIAGPHKYFQYGIVGRIRRDDREKTPVDYMPCYKYFSGLTKPAEGMKVFLNNLPLNDELGNHEKARIVSEALYDYFEYVPGATHVGTSAEEAFSQGKGVCQDYAHVFLSMARILGIPARYVSGLPEGDGASHAWAEIWHDGLWYGFDPTRNKLVDEGYITLCYGRDYNDCPIERGLFFGNTNQTQTTWMEVQDRFNQ